VGSDIIKIKISIHQHHRWTILMNLAPIRLRSCPAPPRMLKLFHHPTSTSQQKGMLLKTSLLITPRIELSNNLKAEVGWLTTCQNKATAMGIYSCCLIQAKIKLSSSTWPRRRVATMSWMAKPQMLLIPTRLRTKR